MLVWLGALSHARAREVLEAAFRNIFKRSGEMPELQYAQSVALGEGGQYGSGCYKNRQTGESYCDTHNWGAAQCSQLPPCPTGCVEATDTKANGTPYQACFKTYSTDEAGAAGYLRTLYGGDRGGVLSLARQGRFEDAVHEQHRTRYFQLDPDRYWEAVDRNVDKVAAALGEPRGDHGSIRLLARVRLLLPYAIAVGAAAAGAYYFVPQFRVEARKLARSGRKFLSF
jgi:hypothetical protein